MSVLGFGGLGAVLVGFAGWQTADLNVHKKTRPRLANGMGLQRRQAKASKKASSTTAVVPGAAPAMAKAGVGGYLYIYMYMAMDQYL